MTEKGTVYFPTTMYCPDKWKYAFDGQFLELTEEFDEIPEEGLEMACRLLGQLGYEVKREGNILSLKKEVSQGEAARYCFGEFLVQATALGRISRETMVHVTEELDNIQKRLPELERRS